MQKKLILYFSSMLMLKNISKYVMYAHAHAYTLSLFLASKCLLADNQTNRHLF